MGVYTPFFLCQRTPYLVLQTPTWPLPPWATIWLLQIVACRGHSRIGWNMQAINRDTNGEPDMSQPEGINSYGLYRSYRKKRIDL